MRCERCELGCNAAQNWVVAEPPDNARVMVIGDNPYEWEGVPFTSKPAGFLKSHLQVDAYYTYAVKCSTPEGAKVPSKAMKTCVNEYLLEEVKAIRPQYILVVGAPALKAVLGKAKITEVAGQTFDWMGAKLMPIISPSAVFRDPSKEGTFKRTIAKFHDLMGGLKRSDSEVPWELFTEDKRELFWSQMENETGFTYDLETTSLKYYLPDERVNCIGIDLPQSQTTWVIPVPSWSPIRLRSFLERMSKYPSCGHNVKFDNLWIWSKFGVALTTEFDTMLASYATDENRSHKLKELAPDLLGVTDYDIADEEKKGVVQDINKLYRYNAKDARYTSRLRYEVFQPKLQEEPEVEALYNKLLIPMSNLFSKIERVGHFVDMDQFAKTEVQLERDIAQSLEDLRRTVGQEINWNSPAQVARVLYDDLGIECRLFTGTGGRSTSEDALADIDHPVVELLQKYRGLTKMLSTYIVGWKPLMHGPYLYTSTKLHGTVTGRFSSRLHQVPRDGTIRNLITAPDGYTFVQADLSQAELRVAAILSGDPELIYCYNHNIDVHWRTAMSIIRDDPVSPFWALVDKTAAKLNLTGSRMDVLDQMEALGPDTCVAAEKAWKEIRKYAKAVNFGFLYGMGGPKFQTYAKTKYGWNITVEKSFEVRSTFFNRYAGLPPWHERQRALVRADGFVHNLAGRKRRLPGIWSDNKGVRAECERQAINSPVQGFIGDFKAMAMLSLDQAIPDEILIQKGEVHDSVLMWVKNEHLQETLPLIKYAMENPPLIKEFNIDLPVPLVVDIEVGRWGAGVTWKG